MDKEISSDQSRTINQSPSTSKLNSQDKNNAENPTQTEEFEMTWQNQKEDMFKHFGKFAQNDEFTDVIIFAGKKAYRVHKVILASASTFFKDALAKQSILCFKPFAELHMLNILTYIYTGKCTVKSKLLHDFKYFAKFLNISGLNFDLTKSSSSQEHQFQQPRISAKNTFSPHLQKFVPTNTDTRNETSPTSGPQLEFEMKSKIPCKIPCNNCIKRIVKHSEIVKEVTFFECVFCGKIFNNKHNLKMHQKNHEDQHNNDSIQDELKKENIVEEVIKQEIDTGEDIPEEITIQNNLKKECDPDMEINK